MLVETIWNLVNLNLTWFVGLIINNLFWAFALGCIGQFFVGKGFVKGGIFITLYLYAFSDISTVTGWVFKQGHVFVPAMVLIGLIIFRSFFGKGKAPVKEGTIIVLVAYSTFALINLM